MTIPDAKGVGSRFLIGDSKVYAGVHVSVHAESWVINNWGEGLNFWSVNVFNGVNINGVTEGVVLCGDKR